MHQPLTSHVERPQHNWKSAESPVRMLEASS